MQTYNLITLSNLLLKTSFSLLLIMVLQFIPISFAKPFYEDIESIRRDVAKMLDDHYAQSKGNTRIEINVANLDSRLQLAKCADSKTFGRSCS